MIDSEGLPIIFGDGRDITFGNTDRGYAVRSSGAWFQFSFDDSERFERRIPNMPGSFSEEEMIGHCWIEAVGGRPPAKDPTIVRVVEFIG